MKKNVALSTSAHDDAHTGVPHAAQLTRLGFRTVLFDFDLTLVNQHCYQNDITLQAVRDTPLSGRVSTPIARGTKFLTIKMIS